MLEHKDYITHINNKEDRVYLKNKHFPVNMRLFKTSLEYRTIIQQQCRYISRLCLRKMNGYKLPHGMSSANAGLSFNIIAIARNRNTSKADTLVMINPKITWYSDQKVESESNCGSLTLDKSIKIKRSTKICVEYYDEDGAEVITVFDRNSQALTIQHEIDHNLGILITDLK